MDSTVYVDHDYLVLNASLLGTGLLCLFFYLLCYAAVLKFFTYYAQYYAHVKELCLKSDCSIREYSLASKNYLIRSVFY